MKLHLLHESDYCQNGIAMRFPIWFSKNELQERGVDVRFFQDPHDPELLACDTLLVSSKAFSRWWTQKNEALFAWLEEASSKTNLVWADVSDSTGTTHFQVLPYVEIYIKAQLLQDRRRYQETWYGSRIFTDAYHRKTGTLDDHPGEPHLNHIPTDEELKKVQVGWNSGMFHYGQLGWYLGKVWHSSSNIPAWYPKLWHTPSAGRRVRVSCRIGVGHGKNTVTGPRREIRERLSGFVQTHKVSRGKYFSELRKSVAAVSPFGLGEISLRDFECIVSGAGLIKQDMSHLETWPNVFREGAYLPFRWDLADLEDVIRYAIDHPNDIAERASFAQQIYKNALFGTNVDGGFCERLLDVVNS